MNDRYKELSRKAAIMLREKERPELGELEPKVLEKIVSLRQNYDKIFAQLIIKECTNIPFDMWDKAELNADNAVKIENRIKDHFGIEKED